MPPNDTKIKQSQIASLFKRNYFAIIDKKRNSMLTSSSDEKRSLTVLFFFHLFGNNVPQMLQLVFG